MIEKFSYVFIIGAGGGKPYNFPLGTKLYENIKNNYYNYTKEYFSSGRNFGHLDTESKINNAKRFCEELGHTSGVSIDKYLNVNTTFKENGIQAIVAEICNCERESLLPMGSNEIKGDWYTYLYQKMIEGLNKKEDLLRIGQNKISFITFNYDRSLEHFLFENIYGLLKNAGVNREQIANAISPIKFLHVYGKTGHLPWQVGAFEDERVMNVNKEDVKYGGETRPVMQVAMQVHKMINVMYDERKESSDIKEAQDLIRNADRIMFLGLGYDDQNLKLLGMPQLLEGKRIYGTAYKATKNEIIHIGNKLNLKESQAKSHIYDFDCLMLLREHLV